MPDSIVQLMDQLQNGDEEAARRVFRHHVEPLVSRVRVRLSKKLKRRFDPEDVVQSAFRSFFAHAKDGKYHCDSSDDLWRLLVKITWYKLLQRVEYETAQMRTVDREQEPASSVFRRDLLALDRSPTAESEAVVQELIEGIVSQLTPTQAQIFELRLDGFLIEDIASKVHRSERTIRRVLDVIRSRLHDYLDERQQ
jgi:DNA-directed RNA polymerase specialized sigma24 family protein